MVSPAAATFCYPLPYTEAVLLPACLSNLKLGTITHDNTVLGVLQSEHSQPETPNANRTAFLPPDRERREILGSLSGNSEGEEICLLDPRREFIQEVKCEISPHQEILTEAQNTCSSRCYFSPQAIKQVELLQQHNRLIQALGKQQMYAPVSPEKLRQTWELARSLVDLIEPEIFPPN